MDLIYVGAERRQFIRLDFEAPLSFKVCKKETVTRLLSGYTSNVSETGLLCKITEKVNIDDILWLAFDRGTLSICSELEKNALIYQSGVIGKVVRIIPGDLGDFEVGISFVTREEANLTHIYPKVHFLETELNANDKQA
ncbi:MAG: PilZ domain-containing protein [Candidatus Omnitrophota bacterium]|nr:PilZ domain-containing protein [Candidatus Omnitrophota bacterium]